MSWSIEGVTEGFPPYINNINFGVLVGLNEGEDLEPGTDRISEPTIVRAMLLTVEDVQTAEVSETHFILPQNPGPDFWIKLTDFMVDQDGMDALSPMLAHLVVKTLGFVANQESGEALHDYLDQTPDSLPTVQQLLDVLLKSNLGDDPNTES